MADVIEYLNNSLSEDYLGRVTRMISPTAGAGAWCDVSDLG